MKSKMLVMFMALHGSAIALGTCLVMMLTRAACDPGPTTPDDDGAGAPHPSSPGPLDGALQLTLARPARRRVREPVCPGASWHRPWRRSHARSDRRRVLGEHPAHAGDGHTRRAGPTGRLARASTITSGSTRSTRRSNARSAWVWTWR